MADNTTGDDLNECATGVGTERTRRRKPSWPAAAGIAGPACGKMLAPPNKRHFLRGVKHGVVRGVNSVVLRGYEGDVRRDVRDIAAGHAHWNPQTGRYEINGRSYGVEESGTVFPDSGDGIVKLNRLQYNALKEIAKVGGDLEKAETLRVDPRFQRKPEVIVLAMAVYNGTCK
ncbi:hypothetical protein [Streptomyces sp. NPDC001269]